jgi:hypothetical protein
MYNCDPYDTVPPVSGGKVGHESITADHLVSHLVHGGTIVSMGGDRNVGNQTIKASFQVLCNTSWRFGHCLIKNPSRNRPWVSAVRQLRGHRRGAPPGGTIIGGLLAAMVASFCTVLSQLSK